MARKPKRRNPTEPLEFDRNPVYAVRRTGNTFVHWMAFDPKHGPESEAQITWHIAQGTPGAELWEVGTPAAPFA